MMEDLQRIWQKALRETEILRARISALFTFKPTDMPYIFLAPSSVNVGDTVVRKGKVIVYEASLILPRNFPIFEGFEFEQDYHVDADTVRTFLLVRGVSFPSFKYHHQTYNVDIHEGPLEKAIKHYMQELERKEDVHTGLITGPEDCWQFSVLIFVAAMVQRCAPDDIRRLLEELRRREGLS